MATEPGGQGQAWAGRGTARSFPAQPTLSFPRGTGTLPAARLSQAKGRACSSPLGADGGWAGVRHRLCSRVQAAHGEDGHGCCHGAASSHADSSEEGTEGHWVPRDDYLMPEAGPANRACAQAHGGDTAQLHPPA